MTVWSKVMRACMHANNIIFSYNLINNKNGKLK